MKFLALILFVVLISTIKSRDITFSGYNYRVKSCTTQCGPGSNYFSDATDYVWVDGSNRLHLKVAQNPSAGNRWECSEVIPYEALGYGLYCWGVDFQLEYLDPHIVLGLFTWSDYSDNYYTEIDIEFSKWSDPYADNGHFSVQPYDISGNTYAYNYTDKPQQTMHCFEWKNDYIHFASFSYCDHINCIHDDNTRIDTQWKYTNVSGIPPPNSTHPRINFWITNGPPSQESEMIINNFEFSLTETIDAQSSHSIISASFLLILTLILFSFTLF
eukprot:Anaeramoba_ignava/c16513_g1_i1.p1 GENE.c16513_g1_i1~~c16513_g1_i1.p1  ORF type:complete len:272 (+),score=54.82 c16513_g1_i1:111-926(+)